MSSAAGALFTQQAPARHSLPAGPLGGSNVELTARELGVVLLLGEGMTAVAIAHRLGISPRTVHKHLENIYAKLGVSDRLSAVLRVQSRRTTPR